MTTVLVSEKRFYQFFRELGEPLEPNVPPPVPSPEVMQQLFEIAARYRYWIGSRKENAAIGIDLA